MDSSTRMFGPRMFFAILSLSLGLLGCNASDSLVAGKDTNGTNAADAGNGPGESDRPGENDGLGEGDGSDEGGSNDVNTASTWKVVDTGQSACYDNASQITCPAEGSAFYGQDAHHDGIQMSYQDNGDGTITDLNTGLTWQQTPDFVNLRSWGDAQTCAASLQLAGHGDWPVPTIKELYSLIHLDVTGQVKTSHRRAG